MSNPTGSISLFPPGSYVVKLMRETADLSEKLFFYLKINLLDILMVVLKAHMTVV